MQRGTNTEIPQSTDARLLLEHACNRLEGKLLLRRLRPGFWILAVLLGAAHTWNVRHSIFSDGISYIEIAKAYARGDWSTAINSYWSPLYSWILAVAYLILRPTAYWDVAVLHLVNFGAYILSLASFEFFMRELIRFRTSALPNWRGLPDTVLYFAGYCTILFAGLSIVTMWYCSPDMLALFLLLLLSGLLLRVVTTGGSTFSFVAIGLVSGLSFLARTAFAPTFIVCLGVLGFLAVQKGERLWRPILITATVAIVCSAPFVAAISLKTGRFTLGDSGALNYGWEIDGAARYAHWQGEPGDIGKPKHPTREITSDPHSYSFAGPVPGTYPPWFNPAYWYEGIQPKLKWKPQLQVLFVNLTVLGNLFLRSAALLSVVAVLLLSRDVRRWLRNTASFWPVLVPCFTILALYCVVYVEKRYIAGNLVILWMILLAATEGRTARLQVWAPRLVLAICIFYTGAFVLRRQTYPVYDAVRDLASRGERYRNVQYLIADHLLHAGLRPGDKIAYIGPAVDADWARIAGVKIVAEIPIVYERLHRPLNNTLRMNAVDIRGFWTAPAERRAAILKGFVQAGARLLVTDGFYERQFVSDWPRAIPASEPGVPKFDWDNPHQFNTRYQWLATLLPSSRASTR